MQFVSNVHMEQLHLLLLLATVALCSCNGESFGLDGESTGTLSWDDLEKNASYQDVPKRNCSRMRSSNALRRCLTGGWYDEMLPPSMVFVGVWEPTDVVVGMNYRALLDVNEKAQLLLIDIGIEAFWLDPRLVYNDSIAAVQYGLEFLSFEQEDIWHPIIDVTQRTFLIDGPGMRKVRLDVAPNGMVRMEATIIDWFACGFSNELFPFDEQICTQTFTAAHSVLHFGSLLDGSSYNNNEEKGNLAKYKRLVGSHTNNGEWDVKWERSGAVRSAYIGSPFMKSYLDFRIVLKRYAASHSLVWLTLPTLLVFSCTICIAVGCAPDERYSFVGSIVVALFLLAVALADKLPVTGNKVPLVTVFYIVLALVLFGSLLLCHACAFLRDMLVSVAKTHSGQRLVNRWALAAATENRLEITAAVLLCILLCLILYGFNDRMNALNHLTEA